MTSVIFRRLVKFWLKTVDNVFLFKGHLNEGSSTFDAYKTSVSHFTTIVNTFVK